jgi:hypothetical protein
MGKQRAPLEFNRLGGGIITEASPLTFPDDASIDEVNFEIRNDGSRRRRLGFDKEAGGIEEELMVYYTNGDPTIVNSFLWKNVSGRTDISYVCIQVDSSVYFYRTELDTLSLGKIDYIYNRGALYYEDEVFGFASIDGKLAIATGDENISILSVDLADVNVPVFSKEQERLTIRDLFGVAIEYNIGVESGYTNPTMIDITDPIYYTKRPLPSGLPLASQGLTTSHVSSSYVETQVGQLNPSTMWTASGFVQSSFSGFTLDYWYLLSTTYRATLLFTSAPSFETISVYDNVLSAYLSYSRSSFSNKAYTADLTQSQHTTLKNASSISFELTNTVVGTTYNYNLRNQTFATKRLPKTTETKGDPIAAFLLEAGHMPSMSDTVLSALYPNVEATNKTADRFHAEDLEANPLGNSPAPKGFFIIDALERSTSRLTRWTDTVKDQGYNEIELDDLPYDITPGGAKVVAEYGGRLWYGGFSEKGNETQVGGTRLESFLLYSQLANSKDVLTRCYQIGDPTSIEEPELLETDGGFISLDGAYGINRLIPIGNSIMVFAENGVWAVTGSDGNYFSPTMPRVQKVTDKGCLSARAVVAIDTSVMYWTDAGIYLIAFTDAGTYEVSSLTEKTIQTLYDDIPYVDKRNTIGAYDEVSKEVLWTYYATPDRVTNTKVLLLKTNTGAFTTYTIGDTTEVESTTLAGFAEVPRFVSQPTIENVTSEGVQVTSEGVDVTAIKKVFDTRNFNVKGIVLEASDLPSSGLSHLTFGEFNNQDYEDWASVDAEAYIVTGYVSGGDLQRQKQIQYVTMHLTRTEDGFEYDEGGDIVPTHQSSCYLQGQWDWANSAEGGRWTRVAQAYRYRRHFIPTDVNSPYDSGERTINTRNKVRGKGRVLSLKLSTEEGKDCRLLGWSAIMEVQDSV